MYVPNPTHGEENQITLPIIELINGFLRVTQELVAQISVSYHKVLWQLFLLALQGNPTQCYKQLPLN